MDWHDVIAHYYPSGSLAHRMLVDHGKAVAAKAMAVAEKVAHLAPDRDLIFEAAMLHDIGMFKTRAPEIGCFGHLPYICHGYLGRELLEPLGLSKHALVCERHVGVGLSSEEIRTNKFPLPERDMVPQTLEERIVCYADKFFSKNGGKTHREKSIREIIAELMRYGPEKAEAFQAMANMFE